MTLSILNSDQVPELLIQIFTETGLTIIELIKIRQVCKNWQSIIEDPKIGKLLLKKIQRVLIEGENWILYYKHLHQTIHWFVVDTSNSMNYPPSELPERDNHFYDLTEETPWERTKLIVSKVFDFLAPVAPNGIQVCSFNTNTIRHQLSKKSDLDSFFQGMQYGEYNYLESALTVIDENVGTTKSIELFIFSDFHQIPSSETIEILGQLASKVSLIVNFLNVGFYRKPEFLSDIEKIKKRKTTPCIYRMNYKLLRDGKNRERGPFFIEEKKDEIEGPPPKKQKKE